MNQTQEVQSTKIYDTTVIAKLIREQLKKAFPTVKFSVTAERYSGGSSIHLSVMESDFQIVQDFSAISEEALQRQQQHNGWQTLEQIKTMQAEVQAKGYHQLNHHYTHEEYNEIRWNNGVYLTQAGHELMGKITEIAQQWNWDNSDAQSDYFDVNYYLHLAIGKWNKPYTRKVSA